METPLKFLTLGARLMVRSQIPSNAPHELKETVMPIGDGIKTDIYLPPARVRKKVGHRGVVLMIHGMAPLGARDDRAVHLATCMASLGYIMVLPMMEEVRRLEIKRETMVQTVEIIKTLSRDRALCPTGKLAILAPSFSGALALVAAGQPEVAAAISSICLIGPPADMISAIDFFMIRDDADPYGYLIIFKNFLHYSVGNRKKLFEALSLAAEDDAMKRVGGEPRLPAHIKTMTEKDRKLFDELLSSKEVRQQHWGAMREKLRRNLDGLLPLPLLPNIRGNITLIHGLNDDVIAPEESELIYEKMRAHGIPGRLLITPLISHGDHSLSPRMILDALSLAGAFGNFFHHI